MAIFIDIIIIFLIFLILLLFIIIGVMEEREINMFLKEYKVFYGIIM